MSKDQKQTPDAQDATHYLRILIKECLRHYPQILDASRKNCFHMKLQRKNRDAVNKYYFRRVTFFFIRFEYCVWKSLLIVEMARQQSSLLCLEITPRQLTTIRQQQYSTNSTNKT